MKSDYSRFAVWRCDAEHCSDSGGGECVLYFVTKGPAHLPLAADYDDRKYDIYCFHSVKLIDTVEKPEEYVVPEDSSDGRLHQGLLYNVCPLFVFEAAFAQLYGVSLPAVEEWATVICVLVDGEGVSFPLLVPLDKVKFTRDMHRLGLKDFAVVENRTIKRRRAA